MKLYEITKINNLKEFCGYASIHDSDVDRTLFIEDDDGNTVEIKNKQIGELFRYIKPALLG